MEEGSTGSPGAAWSVAVAGVIVLAALVLAAVLWRYLAASVAVPAAPEPAAEQVTLGDLLAADLGDAGLESPPPRALAFPADHGPHPAARTEWWHLTGTLQDGAGRRLGVQLALVRLALGSESDSDVPALRPERPEVYAALLSLSDPAGGTLHAHQRIGRSDLGLAGAGADPVRVWVLDWGLEVIGTTGGAPDLRAHLVADGLGLELDLRNARAPVDGDALGEPGAERSAPFRLYVQPRLAGRGTLRAGERAGAVTGVLALEHAWGELPLPGGPVARDRFTLHLADGRELLCLRTHRVDGTGTPATTGLLTAAGEPPVLLSSAEVELTPTEHWTSPRTGARYPVRWALRIPARGMALELIPDQPDQEAVVWAPFWAGPVRVRGTAATGPVAGEGFVQLNGYEGR